MQKIFSELKTITGAYGAELVAVSKTKSVEDIMSLYNMGQRIFGENRVQELVEKQRQMPKDIEWHMIGHLQKNKVKYLAPFVDLIHAVDSWVLLKMINKEALKNNRSINILLQLKIANEESKYGLSHSELISLLEQFKEHELTSISIHGLMGMATFTDDKEQIRSEFKTLKNTFNEVKELFFSRDADFKILSMGMSGDYKIALAEGSTLIRVGSLLFGER